MLGGHIVHEYGSPGESGNEVINIRSVCLSAEVNDVEAMFELEASDSVHAA